MIGIKTPPETCFRRAGGDVLPLILQINITEIGVLFAQPRTGDWGTARARAGGIWDIEPFRSSGGR